jgi:diguanylate cyclase (GGDEF)-like protein
VAAVETFHEIGDKVAALEQVRQLQELVYLDPLTRIANRRFLQATLEARIAERGRYGWPFGIIMMDVDHFKAVNDTYGHEVGDRVLKTVARTLRAATRSYDVVGRWGGEEFLAVVANATAADLASVGERYRALVESSDVPLDGVSLRVTISAGAAVAQDTDDAASAVERADRLLYMSKTNGRNRVTLVEPEGKSE